MINRITLLRMRAQSNNLCCYLLPSLTATNHLLSLLPAALSRCYQPPSLTTPVRCPLSLLPTAFSHSHYSCEAPSLDATNHLLSLLLSGALSHCYQPSSHSCSCSL